MPGVATLALLEMVLNQQIFPQELQHHRLHVAARPAAVPGEERRPLSDQLRVLGCLLSPAGLERLEKRVEFSSVAQLCLTLCDPMECDMSGLSVHPQLLEFT